MKVWQIASGEPGRDYRKIFFDHDVMILGPSRKGNALENDYFDGIPNSIFSQVHNFARKPLPGDRVILRHGHSVIGIGEIPQGDINQYAFDKAFSCVYGWDLSHCRRVIWAKDVRLNSFCRVFADAKQKPSFTRVHETQITKLVESIEPIKFKRTLRKLPKVDTSRYTEEEFGISLFSHGFSNKNIEDIFRAIRQADRLTSWYRSDESGRKPSENEVVSHILLPLFLGLGWSHQQIAVEWKNVDMAFFKNTPTTSNECVMIVEAKGLGQPLSEVLKQPIEYIVNLKLRNTKYIVTTDGANLFVYKRKGKNWIENPIGYINVGSLQKENILPENTNLIDTLVKLQPNFF